MSKHLLITGGAGFIGSHLADELLACGDRVAYQAFSHMKEDQALLLSQLEGDPTSHA